MVSTFYTTVGKTDACGEMAPGFPQKTNFVPQPLSLVHVESDKDKQGGTHMRAMTDVFFGSSLLSLSPLLKLSILDDMVSSLSHHDLGLHVYFR